MDKPSKQSRRIELGVTGYILVSILNPLLLHVSESVVAPQYCVDPYFKIATPKCPPKQLLSKLSGKSLNCVSAIFSSKNLNPLLK